MENPGIHIKAKKLQEEVLDTDLHAEGSCRYVNSSALGEPVVAALKVVLNSDRPVDWSFTDNGQLAIIFPRHRVLVVDTLEKMIARSTRSDLRENRPIGLEWFEFKYSSAFWLLDEYGTIPVEDVEEFISNWIEENI